MTEIKDYLELLPVDTLKTVISYIQYENTEIEKKKVMKELINNTLNIKKVRCVSCM